MGACSIKTEIGSELCVDSMARVYAGTAAVSAVALEYFVNHNNVNLEEYKTWGGDKVNSQMYQSLKALYDYYKNCETCDVEILDELWKSVETFGKVVSEK